MHQPASRDLRTLEVKRIEMVQSLQLFKPCAADPSATELQGRKIGEPFEVDQP